MKSPKKRIKKRFHPYPKPKKNTNLRKNKTKTKRPRKYLIATLFPFQSTCCLDLLYRRQAGLKASVITWQAGSGKTLTALNHIDDFGWNALWICPDTLFDKTFDQIQQHFQTKIKINAQLSSNKWDRFHISLVTMTTFTRLDMEHDVFRHIFHTIVLDEIHTISTKKKLLQHVSKLKSNMFLGLTATPGRFDCDKIIPFKQAFHYSMQHLNMIQPEVIICVHDVPMSTKVVYNDIIDKENANSINMFLKLRKLLSHTRIPFLLEQLPNYIKHPEARICFFSEFNETLFALALQLPINSFLKIDSTTSSSQRFKLLQKFEKKSAIRYLLCSKSIVGLGNDLGYIDALVLCEPPYHKEDDIQLVGRLTRLGQAPQHLEKQLVLQFMYKQTCEESLHISKN
jgi:superfamily II DNA or RNA helicase